jgi:GH35 family endo-1,4-beta-xylanase
VRLVKKSLRPKRACKLIVAAALAASAPALGLAQTSLTGASITHKSNNSATLSSIGYIGTYLVVPVGGATVNFTVNATAAAGVTTAPHMNLVIADSISGFSVGNTLATNYTTSNITLPAGTYFVRNERDYSGNVGVARSFTVNNLSVSTVSGSAAAFSNTAMTSSQSNALAAANTYIENFRKAAATVSLSGPGSIPLLAGTPIQADLARHSFNWGTAVSGNSAADVDTFFGNGGTSKQVNYQAKLKQNFNTIVPGNGGKWQNNEFTRDNVTMQGVDQILTFAQNNNMRARMHNLIWGKNSFNGQQPSWVLNSSNTGLLDQANNTALTLAQRDAARAELRAEITERINYYLDASRASRMVEMDVYNESIHEPEYTTGLGYDNVDGYASIHNEAAAKAPNVKMFTNEYNIFADSYNPANVYQPYNNWYLDEVSTIRSNGGNVGGIGAQYYPNNTGIGTGNGQHNAGRMAAVWQNLSTHGLPVALTEFGVKTGGDATLATQILEEAMRLTFGTPNATGFMMWGFWTGEGLFAGGTPFYDNNWNIQQAGQKWQDLLGIADWDANASNAWDTNLATLVDANGAINFNGFFGDYYLRGQTSGAYDMTLLKGTSAYNLNMATPPTWSIWNTGISGVWSSAGNWTAGGSPNSAGQTAYFGSSAPSRTVTVDGAKTVGMLAFNSLLSYTLSGGGSISLEGFNNSSGNVAAMYVANGNHVIDVPLTMLDDTTVTLAAGSILTAGQLQNSSATLNKRGSGTLVVNRLHGGGVVADAGTIRVQPLNGVSVATTISIAPAAALDLANNDLVIEQMSFSNVQAMVLAGLNNTAGGITSSTSDGSQILALFDNALVGATEWSGQAIGANAIVGKYTYFGDANIDGQVTGDDYTVIDANLGTSPLAGLAWLRGDMNLDGTITGDDYTVVDAKLGLGVGNPLVSSALTAIPEPSAFGFASAALLASATRRRRRN